ncbi:hypothetical protein KJF94_07025 [Pseudomonas hormoni]|uniref:Uncharacterized protein n=1 Tax=Pseudomonas hormoni TaxID=3093767 RepID=A0ABX8F1B7_9PSED|nr:hypothetical protein [Pseudomonas hormoni]QVW25320.1 hypothetical protein KJF94_07025 [Pseudomonas hormoni]
MGTIELSDLRGYFKELAAPAFEEFWFEYQADIPVDIGRHMFIYRRLVTALFFLNHMTDKAAKQRGAENPGEVIRMVKARDPDAGTALDVCRSLTNDVKHPKTQPQTFGFRDRVETDEDGGNQLPCWIYTDKSGISHDLCDIAQRVWKYWIDYRHEREVAALP